MRSIFGKLTLLIIGILIPLLMLEFGLRLLKPDYLLLHPPGLYTTDPAVGYVLTPDFTGEFIHPEFETTISINENGLRGKSLRPKTPNSRRILILGDSQTWGFGVEDHETYAAVMEEHFREQYPEMDIQVLNGGVPGYGTADQLNFLKSRIHLLQPDLVIVQFLSVNDLHENLTPANSWVTIVDGMLASKEPDTGEDAAVPLWEFLQRTLKRNSLLARLTLDTVGYWLTRSGLLGDFNALWGEDFTDEEAQLGVDYLNQVAETAMSEDAKVLFLYTTGQAHVLTDDYTQPPSAMIVETAAEQAGVLWEDAASYLQQQPNKTELYFAQNGHWTVAGHQVIAELLEEVIAENNLLPNSQTE